jgi:Tfp pilus assembly protein PilW
MSRSLKVGAFTMPELLIACGIGSLIMACLVVGAMTLQRGYSAAEHQLRSQVDQMRIVDYITRDLRRASTVTTTNGNRKLVLTLADMGSRDPATAELLAPAPSGDGIRYGAGPVTVSYYVEGDTFIRQHGSEKQVIATKRIEQFLASITAFPLVSFELSFMPIFSRGSTQAAQEAARVSTAVWVRNATGLLR